MPSETLNTGFRRHLFTVELSPSSGEVFQRLLSVVLVMLSSLNPHVVGRVFRVIRKLSFTAGVSLNPHVVGRFFRVGCELSKHLAKLS